MIPKHIVQTFPDPNIIPGRVSNEIARFLKINDDYHYTLFSDTSMYAFVHQYFDDNIRRAYDDLNSPVAKTDLWRYLFLYQEGGVYLDMDATIICTLSDFLSDSDSCLISTENFKNLYVQWALVFAPNHPILELTINRVVKNIQTRRNPTVHGTTGPVPFAAGITDYYRKNPDLNFTWDSVTASSDFRLCVDDLCNRFYSRMYHGLFRHKYKGHEVLYDYMKEWRLEQKQGIYNE